MWWSNPQRRFEKSLNLLVTVATPLECDLEKLPACMLAEPAQVTSRQNGYSDQQIHRVVNPPVRVTAPHDGPYSVLSCPV
jgi:hypothetical protein